MLQLSRLRLSLGLGLFLLSVLPVVHQRRILIVNIIKKERVVVYTMRNHRQPPPCSNKSALSRQSCKRHKRS